MKQLVILSGKGGTGKTSVTAAFAHLADVGFDPAYGARPLKRAIQNQLQNPLAKELLSGAFDDGDTVRVRRADEGAAGKGAKAGKGVDATAAAAGVAVGTGSGGLVFERG